MKMLPDGRVAEAIFRASPHFNERPENEAVSLIVIHNISLPAGHFGTGFVNDLFLGTINTHADPSFADLEGLHVSSHFFIDRQGMLFQYVPCLKRAWHAGVSNFEGREGCNDFSIGIELEGTDTTPYTEEQYRTLAELTDLLCREYPIQAVTAHSIIAPLRKTDPGPAFDWQKYQNLCTVLRPIRFPHVGIRG